MEFVSDGIETLTGYSPGAFTVRPRLSFAGLIHPDDREGVEKAVQDTASSGARFQVKYRIRCANGAIRWVWEQGSTVAGDGDGDGHAMLEGFITDITRMHEAETLIQEQASFLQRARDAIVAFDTDSRIDFWNRGAERLYGWTMEQVRGLRFCDLVCEHLPDYLEACEATLEHGEWYGELTHFRSDGSTIVAETSCYRTTPASARRRRF
jgi:PAS domain S-box-containing protein